MAVVPTGAPAWLRVNDFETYGGNTSKRNYMAQGSTDPTTDVSAEQFSRMVEDMAQVARVASFATLTYQCNDSSPGAPTVLNYDPMAGGAPVGTRNGDGDVTWKWDASYLDSYGVSAQFHIGHAKAGWQNATTSGAANHEISDSDADGLNDSVQIVARDNTNTPVTDAIVTLTIWTSVVP
jgi:hypothetical protein